MAVAKDTLSTWPPIPSGMLEAESTATPRARFSHGAPSVCSDPESTRAGTIALPTGPTTLTSTIGLSGTRPNCRLPLAVGSSQ